MGTTAKHAASGIARANKGRKALIVALSCIFAGALALGGVQQARAAVTSDKLAKADGDVNEYIAPSGTTNGVQGVYLGNRENITGNEVMLLTGLTFKKAADNGIAISGSNGILNQATQPVVENYQAASGGTTHWNPLVVTVPDSADWTVQVPTDATYTQTNEDGTTSTYWGKIVDVPGSATLTWKDAAVLKDGTICDVEMTISDIKIRLNPGTKYEAGDQFVILAGNASGGGGLSASSRFAPSPNRADSAIASYGSSKWAPGVGFNVTMKIKPQDGSTCAEHDSDKMIYYFTDLDASDGSIPMGSDADNVWRQKQFGSEFAESVQMMSGVNGPVVIEDKTYNDLTTGSGNNLKDSTNVLYFADANTPDPSARLFNEERMQSSKGTWFSASHNTDSAPDTTYSGFITTVNPDGFSFRWRGNNAGSALMAQSDFEPRLRVVNVGRYPNTLVTTDLTNATIDSSTGLPSDTGVVNADTGYDVSANQGKSAFHRTANVVRYNPTYYLKNKSPLDTAPEGSSGLGTSITHTYYVPWKSSKVIKVEAKEGYHLTQFSVTDNCAWEDEVNQNVIDVEAMAVGETKNFGNEHKGMYVVKESASAAYVFMNEDYTELDGTAQKGYLTDHTLRVASAPSILTVHKRWIGEADPTTFELQVIPRTQTNAIASEFVAASVTVDKKLADRADDVIAGTNIQYVVDNGNGTWTINYPVEGGTDVLGRHWPKLPTAIYSASESSNNNGTKNLQGYVYHGRELSITGDAWHLSGEDLLLTNSAGASNLNERTGYTNDNDLVAGSSNGGSANTDRRVNFGTYGDTQRTGGYINNVEYTDVEVKKVWKNADHLTTADKKQLLEDNLTLGYKLGEDVTRKFQLALEQERLAWTHPDGSTLLTSTFVTGNLTESPWTERMANPTIDTNTWTITYEDLPKYQITYKNKPATTDGGGQLYPNAANTMYTIEKVQKIDYYVTETTLDGFLDPVYENEDDAATTADESTVEDKALSGGTITNEVTPPEGTDKVTYGKPGETQKGKPTFEAGSGDIPDTGAYTLIDENGDPQTSITIPGEGKYTIDPDTGEVTFEPEVGFTGTGTGVTVQVTDSNGQKATAKYTPVIPEPKVTKDGQYASDGSTNTQSATVEFPLIPGANDKTPTGEDNAFTYKLVGPEGNEVDTLTVDGEGTYTIDPDTGEITFTPDPDFTGKATPVPVKGTDKMGNTAETTYTPIVVPNKQTVTLTREIEYRYVDDKGNEVATMVTKEYTFERIGTYNSANDDDPQGYNSDSNDPDDQTTIDYPAWTPQTATAPANPDGGEGWTAGSTPEDIGGLTPDNAAENGFVAELDASGKPTGKLVRHDTVYYTPDPPVGTPEETYGEVGQTQTADATTLFKVATPTTKTGDANEIVSIQLVDPATGEATDGPVAAYDADGNPCGTYEIDPATGIVTFKPEPGFVGTPKPATLIATDKNGLTATTTYQPHVYNAAPLTSKDGQYDSSDASGNTLRTQSVDTTSAFNLPKDIDRIKLVDPDTGEETDSVTVPGEGTYTIDENGTITFTPEEGFTGKASGVEVRATDTDGHAATTTYTPIVVPNKQTETLTREIEYRYVDDEGNEVTKMVTETYTFVRVGSYNPAKDDHPTEYGTTGDASDQATIDYPAWTPQSPKTPASPDKSADGWTVLNAPEDLKGITPDNATELGFVADEDGNLVRHDTVYYAPDPPEGTPKHTYGEVGQPQKTDATKLFKTTTATTKKGEPNEIVSIQLVDPDTGEATDGPVVAYDADGKPCGTFEIDPATGIVTFKPDPDYQGVPDVKPATLIATDKNGLTATATYQPHTVNVKETRTESRTIDYVYDDGSPVLDENGNPLKVVQEVTFERQAKRDDEGNVMLDENGKVVWEDWTPAVSGVDSVKSPVLEDGWYTDDTVVDGVDGVTVDNAADKLKDVTVVYHKPPTASEKKTFGGKGETQKGTPPFTKGSTNFTSFTLVDPETGEPTSKIVVEGEGTYTVDPETGEVTFVPEPDFVGTATKVTVRGTDANGNTADGYYTPTVVDNTQTQDKVQKIEYVYDDGTPVLGEDGTPLVEERTASYTRTGTVDPETGEITWNAWEPKSLEQVDSPAVEGYTPDKATVVATSATPDTWPADEKVVYSKQVFTVTFVDGSNGKSDGAGNEGNKPYGSNPKGGNTVTPDTGYEFTGFYTYVITKPDGTTETGRTNDPTSVIVTGNIVFTPEYKKIPWAMWIDPATGQVVKVPTDFNDDGSEPTPPEPPTRKGYNFAGWDREVDSDGNVTYKAKWTPQRYALLYNANGGSGSMDSQNFTGEDTAAVSKTNEFTRDGYEFTGFKAKLPDGSYLKGANGEDLVFATTEDFMAYFYELGDGAEITLEAQWRPVDSPKTYWVTYVDPATGRVIMEKTTVPAGGEEPAAPADPKRAGYVFDGWERTVDAEGNVTYTAKWKPATVSGGTAKGAAATTTPRTVVTPGTATQASQRLAKTADDMPGGVLVLLAASALVGAAGALLARRRELAFAGDHAK